MTQTALVLGATGRFGRNMVIAFENAGWRVRSFDRRTDDLSTAVKGVDVIVHGWNPTYDRWAKDVPVQTKQVIEAAKVSGATVMIPGNVYVYGKDAPAIWREDTPHSATNPMGCIRTKMEAAFAASGVQTIVLRGGDYLDTEPSGNWFDMIIVKNLRKGKFVYPGDPNIPRSWAYLPDMCRAFVMLAEKRKKLPVFHHAELRRIYAERGAIGADFGCEGQSYELVANLFGAAVLEAVEASDRNAVFVEQAASNGWIGVAKAAARLSGNTRR